MTWKSIWYWLTFELFNTIMLKFSLRCFLYLYSFSQYFDFFNSYSHNFLLLFQPLNIFENSTYDDVCSVQTALAERRICFVIHWNSHYCLRCIIVIKRNLEKISNWIFMQNFPVIYANFSFFLHQVFFLFFLQLNSRLSDS